MRDKVIKIKETTTCYSSIYNQLNELFEDEKFVHKVALMNVFDVDEILVLLALSKVIE